MVSNIPKIISNLKQIVSGNFLISTEDKGLYITAGASTTSSNACFRSVGAARFRSRHHHSMRKNTDTIVMLSDMPGACNRFLPVVLELLDECFCALNTMKYVCMDVSIGK